VELLAQWVAEIEGGPAEAWRTSVGPLLESVWPRARVLRERVLTRHFTNLVIKSGEAFPEALVQLLPYLTQVQGRERVPALERSQCPESFPRETLISTARVALTIFMEYPNIGTLDRSRADD
jgi:hypothetical protein